MEGNPTQLTETHLHNLHLLQFKRTEKNAHQKIRKVKYESARPKWESGID